MKRYLFTAVFIIIPVLVLIYYYKFYDENNLLSIQCGMYAFTGLKCPGCGGQRALHALLHGNVIQAFKYNGLFIIGLPFLIYLYYTVARSLVVKGTNHHQGLFESSAFGYVFLIVLLLFFIIRNIPFFSFL